MGLRAVVIPLPTRKGPGITGFMHSLPARRGVDIFLNVSATPHILNIFNVTTESSFLAAIMTIDRTLIALIGTIFAILSSLV